MTNHRCNAAREFDHTNDSILPPEGNAKHLAPNMGEADSARILCESRFTKDKDARVDNDILHFGSPDYGRRGRCRDDKDGDVFEGRLGKPSSGSGEGSREGSGEGSREGSREGSGEGSGEGSREGSSKKDPKLDNIKEHALDFSSVDRNFDRLERRWTDEQRQTFEQQLRKIEQAIEDLLRLLASYAPEAPRPKPEPEAPKPKPEPEAPRPKPEPEAPRPKPEPDVPRPKPEPEAPRPKPEPDVPRPKPGDSIDAPVAPGRPSDAVVRWSPRSDLADLTKAKNNYWSDVPTSYWFEPLPQNQKLVDSKIAPEANVWNDVSRIIDTRKYKSSDLVDMPVYDSLGGWAKNEQGAYLRTIKWPKGMEFPREGRTNSPLTVIQPDGTDMSFNKAHVVGNKIIATDRSGAHGGSATSAAGVITFDEMEGLRQGVSPSHKIQVTLWGKYLSNEHGGKRHPSMKADRGWQNLYQGDVPELRMGSTLTFPPSMKPEDLGLETKQGKALFYTMQKYGAVVVDDSAGSTHYIQTESNKYKDGTPLLKNRRRPDEDPFARDINKLFSRSKVVA